MRLLSAKNVSRIFAFNIHCYDDRWSPPATVYDVIKGKIKITG